MPASLIEQLADHLNLEQDEAEAALAALTARLNEEIAATGEAVWPGLGRFHNDEAGLHFEPDDALALAVNQRYAGLEAVAVGSARSSFRKQEVVAPEPEEPAAEADAPPAEPDTLDDVDSDEDEGWQPPEESDDDHPLGPLPRPPFEEADFSVLAGFDETRERSAPPVPPAEAEPEGEDRPLEHAEADEYDVPDEDDIERTTGEPDGQDSPFFEEWSASDFEMEDEVEAEEPLAETDPLEPATELHRPDEPEPEAVHDEDVELEPAPVQAAAEDEAPAAPDTDEEDREQAAFVPPAITPREEASDEAAAVPAAAATAAGAAAPKKPAPQPRSPRAATSRSARGAEKRSRMPQILGGIVAVLLLLLLGLWLFSGDDAGNDNDGMAALTEQSPPPAQAPNADETAPPATDDAPAEAPPGAEAPSAEADAQDAPGAQDAAPGGSATPEGSLTAIDRNAGAWTLVVASWTIESRAEEEAARYADLFRPAGYPVDILRHEENGITRHRVAVGQFPDQAAAEAARESLSGLPEGTWLLRVRPGM